MIRPFTQVDVFTDTAMLGNPVAVVLDGQGLSSDEMQSFARWMNLSETTFVLPPTAKGADYQVRIFTPTVELRFAGHPTLGTCHAWLAQHGPRETVVQQCASGLIPIRVGPIGLEFSAPPLVRDGPVDEQAVAEMAAVLNADRRDIVDARVIDNGPGWVGLLFGDAASVSALRPGLVDRFIGVVGPYPPGAPFAFEVRAFLPVNRVTVEDPVTGSLNAALAQWLISAGRAHPPYLVSQGAARGAAGRVHVAAEPDGAVWIGGGTVTVVTGTVDL